MSDAPLLTKNAVRERFGELNVGSDVYEQLNEEVGRLIDEASERAEENGRRTVKARDV